MVAQRDFGRRVREKTPKLIEIKRSSVTIGGGGHVAGPGAFRGLPRVACEVGLG